MLLFVKQHKNMNLRTILSIPTFLITLSVALMIVTVIPNRKFSQFFSRNQDPLAQAKIYNFLHKDRQIYFETFRRSEGLYKVEPTEGFGNLKKYYELREKLDVSDLPNDFQYAWERMIVNDNEWLELIS